MGTEQIDSHWLVQQAMIEDFDEWLDRDFTTADTIYQQMKHDLRVEKQTFKQIEELYKQHVAEHSEACREDFITRQTMHV